MLMTILTNLPIALAVFILAQLADVVTTNAAIASGRGKEANPVIRRAMDLTGRAWPVVKAAMLAAVAVVVLRYAGVLWLWPVTVITGFVAWRNSRV